MPPDHVFIQSDAEAGLIRNLDEPLVDDRLSSKLLKRSLADSNTSPE
jgi:hypothetical protein